MFLRKPFGFTGRWVTLIRTPDGRWLAAVRLYSGGYRFWTFGSHA